MKCPRCGRPGKRAYKGYCTKVHKLLDAKPERIVQACSGCGSPVSRAPSQISKGGKVFCPRCPKNKGESHPNWHEGQYINGGGYRCILHNGAYFLEHRIAWERANRSCILPYADAIIHHLDFDKLNNDPENLLLLDSQTHGHIHRLIDAGSIDEAVCKLIRFAGPQLYFAEHLEAIERIQRLFGQSDHTSSM